MKLRTLCTTLMIVSVTSIVAFAQPPREGGRRSFEGGPERGGPPGGGPERGGPERGGPPGGGERGGSPLRMLERMFDQVDADGDGAISKAELATAIENEPAGNDRRGNDRLGNDRRGGDDPRRGGPGGRRFGEGGDRPEAGGRMNERRLNEPGGERERPEMGRGPDMQRRRPGGPPPRPGQVLPEFVADQLNLTDEQREQLTALQTQVDERLAEILTDPQKEQLEQHGEHGDHGPHGEHGPRDDLGEQGPRGDRGERGPRGDRDDRGPDGPGGDRSGRPQRPR